MHDKLLVFDIEAVVDRDLIGEEEQKGKFAAPPFWRVVAISFVEANIVRSGGRERYELVECRSGGSESSTERDLIAGFWQHFGKHRSRLVSWNGRGYDLPVLQYRAFMYGVPMHSLYRTGSKWESYKQRYAGEWHCDLMLEMSDYSSRAAVGMNAIASAMGLPGKIGGHGSQVQEMYDSGDLAKIRAYCECDVLNLYALYLRWAFVTGLSDGEGHNQSMHELRGYLSSEGHTRAHLREFAEAWNASTRPQPAHI